MNKQATYAALNLGILRASCVSTPTYDSCVQLQLHDCSTTRRQAYLQGICNRPCSSTVDIVFGQVYFYFSQFVRIARKLPAKEGLYSWFPKLVVLSKQSAQYREMTEKNRLKKIEMTRCVCLTERSILLRAPTSCDGK